MTSHSILFWTALSILLTSLAAAAAHRESGLASVTGEHYEGGTGWAASRPT